jgi:hypothetical protein
MYEYRYEQRQRKDILYKLLYIKLIKFKYLLPLQLVASVFM